MSIRGTSFCGLLAATAFACAALSSSASAASLGAAANATSGIGDAGVVNVHSRGYRHCHWRNGRERCHGGYAGYRYRDYGYYDPIPITVDPDLASTSTWEAGAIIVGGKPA